MLDLFVNGAVVARAPEERHRHVTAGDVGRAVLRVPEYPERGEALAEGRRDGKTAGVQRVLGRGGEGGPDHHGPGGRHGGTALPVGDHGGTLRLAGVSVFTDWLPR